jgi:hypothetical protein
MNRNLTLLSLTFMSVLGSCNAINGPRGGPIILPMPNRGAAAQFERIKSLDGVWEWSEELGPELSGLACSYQITAGGTAVLETLFPGDDYEMVSLYHLDGDQLILTHYGSTGIQPTLRAKPEKLLAGQVEAPIEFACIGGTNMNSEADGHMHRMSFLDIQENELLTSWTFQVDRRPAGDRVFKLSRSAATGPEAGWICSLCKEATLENAIHEAQDKLEELEQVQKKLEATNVTEPPH